MKQNFSVKKPESNKFSSMLNGEKFTKIENLADVNIQVKIIYPFVKQKCSLSQLNVKFC
jgi:hypothetical protein